MKIIQAVLIALCASASASNVQQGDDSSEYLRGPSAAVVAVAAGVAVEDDNNLPSPDPDVLSTIVEADVVAAEESEKVSAVLV